jgi:peroxiredoxin
MNVDCQWVGKNLEALFCDALTESEERLARTHIKNCTLCRNEAHALNAIDPLIKGYFRRELEIARRPRVIHKGRVFGITGAAATVFAVLLFLLIRTPQSTPAVPLLPAPEVNPPVASADTPPTIKQNQTEEPARAKPSPEPSAPADRQPRGTPTIGANAPEFLVADPAGYSHTLDEFRGHVVVIAVWSSNQAESITNTERLYKAFADNPKLRFLGVSSDRQSKPDRTTFPVLYNQGSKLFGAKPGEFVVLDENGTVEGRGSLVRDIDALTRTLRGK